MSLASLVANLSQKAVDLIGDLKGTGSYVRRTNVVFDPATDEQIVSKTTYPNISMVLCKLDTHEMEASPLTLVDAKFLIAKLDLPLIEDPDENDYIVFEGRTFQVLRFTSPPSRPIWILYCKEG